VSPEVKASQSVHLGGKGYRTRCIGESCNDLKVEEVRRMLTLFIVSIVVALLWLAFGDKKDWAGL